MPVSHTIIHVVWKYIFTQKGHTSIHKELRDECIAYGLLDLKKLHLEEYNRLRAMEKENMIKHLMRDDSQEAHLERSELPNIAIDYELEIAEKNSKINMLNKRLATAHGTIVEQNDAFQEITKKLSSINIYEPSKDEEKRERSGGTEIWKADLEEIDAHLNIIRQLQRQFEGEQDKTKELQSILEQLEMKKRKCEAEIAQYAMKTECLEQMMQGYRAELNKYSTKLEEVVARNEEVVAKNERVLETVLKTNEKSSPEPKLNLSHRGPDCTR